METYLENIRKGDKKAFKEYFLTTHKEMLRYASSFLSEIEDMEDVIQDCYVSLWENRNKLDNSKSLKGFLKQTVKNKCLNNIRHEKVKEKYDKELISTHEYFSEFIDEESVNNIHQLLNDLPQTVRKVLELNVVHGLKYAEIAEDMGISVNTVKYHIKVAYRSLRESIKNKSELIYFFYLLKKVKK